MRKAITAIILTAAALAGISAAAVPLSAQVWTAPEPAPGEVRCLDYQTETGEAVSNRKGGGVYVSDSRIALSDAGLQVWLDACNTAAKGLDSAQRYIRCADGSFAIETDSYDDLPSRGRVQNTFFADCEPYAIQPPEPAPVDARTELERCIEYNTRTNRDLAAPRDANGNEYTLLSIRESCEEILAG